VSILPRLCVAALLLVCAVTLHAEWDDEKILRMSPRDIPAAAGLPIKALRFATVRKGALEPVPFQIDEYNKAGLVWFPATGVPLNGKEGIFDGEDRVFALAADLSADALPEGFSPPAGYLGALSATMQGVTRTLHVLHGDFAQSPRMYVRHDIANGTTETPFYTLEVDPKNELNWRYLMVKSWRGNRVESLVDTLKMRISGRVVLARLTLDNDNLRPKVVGVRAGAIRSTIQLETQVVVAGVSVMKMQVQLVRYPRYFEAFTHARIPKLYRTALSDPSVQVTVDGNNLRGAVTRSARSGNAQGLVDGQMDASEQQLIARGLTASDDWILFDSRNGFSMLTFLDVPAELRNIPLELVYQDDPRRSDKPERLRGQFPNVGYGIRGFPPGEDFRFGVTLAFDKDLVGVDPRGYVSRWRAPPEYRFAAVGQP
jgi:hypothetical protein